MSDLFRYTEHPGYVLVEVLIDHIVFLEDTEFARKLDALLSGLGYPNTIVDISRVENIDSAGFGFFITIHRIYEKKGKKIIFVCKKPDILHLIKILQIDKQLIVHSAMGEAVEAM